MVPMSPDRPGDAGRPAAPGPEDPELARVRNALARGAGLDRALSDAAAPTTGEVGMARLGERVRADVEGAGPILQPLIETDGVTDVLVSGGSTWIDRGHGLEPVPSATMDEPQVRALAVRMAASAHKRLDDACPVVDATLPDGTRLNAVLPPLSADGTLISLRTKRRRGFTLAELTLAGTIAPGLDDVLTALVAGRASCLVTGATGTGKTTLLAALLGLVPADERIVCIEEASELRPDHPHVVHLQERGANVQGVGAVSMTSLVRTALRMRPDRIVLGECRGPEVRDVLTALNTGHEGGWATLHANSPADVPARLTALGALAGLDEAAVAAQATSALDAVVHLRRQAGSSGARRYVASIGVLRRETTPAGTVLTCEEALRVDDDGRLATGPAAAALRARIGPQALSRLGPAGSTGLGEGSPL
ncbi:TadA family conjugal transfer-associated ATPase [Actinomyces sp. ZJ308]|uniref:TadA family conjugal transfer-associated ATPase n=1 Tax=Actinomyces sp. ZJ308 TaxID=2708342 RepID=UPI0014241135|nr:TadA family conjugal transfer-associated ATPase [Actinomyces sp. ZJ308]